MTWKGLDGRSSLSFLPLYLGASGMWPAAVGELGDLGVGTAALMLKTPSIRRANTYSVLPPAWASFATSLAYAHLVGQSPPELV